MKIDLSDPFKIIQNLVLVSCNAEVLLSEITPINKKEDLSSIPRECGVYFIYSRPSKEVTWELRYIGQVGSRVTLRQRVSQHLFDHPTSKTNSQSYYILEQTDKFGATYRVVTPESARLLVEAICIENLAPPDNEKGRRREKI